MPGFKEGDKVKIKGQPSSSFCGKVGTVVRSQVYGLAITYDVTFDKSVSHLSPVNKFFEYDLERLAS